MATPTGNQNSKNNNALSNEARVGLGVGLALAAAAGAYFLYGSKNAPKRRAQIRGWMLKAKGEILEKLEQAKEVNEEVYNKIVDSVTTRYQQLKNVDPGELAVLGADLKRHWRNIQQSVKKPVKKSRSKK